MKRRSWLARLALLGIFLLASFATPALAAKDDAEQHPPYDVAGLTHTKVWAPWVFAFLFAAGCLVAAFKNPHRSTSERT